MICGLVLLGSTTTFAKSTENCCSGKEMVVDSVSAENLPMEITLENILFLEPEMEVEMGFNTAEYLPADFNPYAAPSNPMSVSYMEDEEEVVMGFDTHLYLPKNFDPYQKD